MENAGNGKRNLELLKHLDWIGDDGRLREGIIRSRLH